MKMNLALVATLLFALPNLTYSSGNSNMESTTDTGPSEKSDEIKHYPKTDTNSGGVGGSTEEILDRSGRNNSNKINRYDKQEYPESSPGGIMGRYSSPLRKPVKNPDLGYKR